MKPWEASEKYNGNKYDEFLYVWHISMTNDVPVSLSLNACISYSKFIKKTPESLLILFDIYTELAVSLHTIS